MMRILKGAVLALVVTAMLAPVAGAKDTQRIDTKFRKLGLAGFAFLKVAQGARAVGMGDAFVSVADDVNAIYWNPAGLSHLDRPQFVFNYANWYMDTKFQSGAVAFKTPKGVVGIAVMTFDGGKIPERTISQPGGTGKNVAANAWTVDVAYAFKPTDKLGLGMRVRFVQETLYDEKRRSPIFDFGTHFYTGFRSSRVAMSLRNFGKDVTTASLGLYMPLYFTMAGAMEVVGKKGDPAYLTGSIEGSFAVDFEQRWQFGGELWLLNTLALRTGYKANHDAESYAFGAGLKGKFGKRQVTADVAYSKTVDLLQSPLRLSVGASF